MVSTTERIERAPLLIAVEGPDGSGKTTLVKRLALYALHPHVNVTTFHHGRSTCGPPVAQALDYAMQRASILPRFSRRRSGHPAEAKDEVMLFDRWWPSNGCSAQPEGRLLASVEATWLPRLDGIIWCDAPDAVLDERLNQRGERVTAEDAETRSRYRAMKALSNGRWWTSSILLDTSKEDAVLVAARYVLNLAEGTR